MRFLLQRVMFYAIAFWAALTLNFLLPRLMGGNPAAGIIQANLNLIQHDPTYLKQILAEYGNGHESVTKMISEYPTYVKNMLTGNFGISTRYGTPVSGVIRQSLPYSVFVAGSAVILASIIGTFLGMVCAWKRGGKLDNILPGLLTAVGAFPSFFIALLAIYFFGLGTGPLHAHWFPTSLAYDTNVSPSYTWAFVSSVFRHAELPILVLTCVAIGGWLLTMRSVMIANVADDYITMARAKGLRDWRIMTMYAGRNSILPTFTSFAGSLAFVVGGTILVEFVFSYPGMGLQLQQAATGADYPLAQAILLIISACVLFANFVMDSIYVLIDPRTRVS
jgi:peptide/nickel transport system permease protein